VRILALETSADACSAALWLDGEVAGRYEEAPRRHVELILPMVQELLARAGLRMQGLDGIAFGAGPGSFTGVRIAVSAAQGFALAAGLPLVPVSSLAALAARAVAGGAHRVYVTQDARMGEVYWGAYECADDAVPGSLIEETVVAPEAVEVPPGADWHAAGSGWAAHADTLAARTGRPLTMAGDAQVHAADVACVAAHQFAAGLAVPAEQALPVYLRDKVAWARS